MNVSLTPELEKTIGRKVEEGLYGSASEVVREALRLLIERDEMRATRLESLRQEIAVGLADENADRCGSMDADDIQRLGRRLLAERRKQAG